MKRIGEFSRIHSIEPTVVLERVLLPTECVYENALMQSLGRTNATGVQYITRRIC